jgi:KaiC/GvpD/RAD55 family RecA-like ATPase
MRLIKMRGSQHETHPYRLEIEPGGLRVNKLSPEDAAKLHQRRHSHA